MRIRVPLAITLDACSVLVFVIIGRASHAKGESLGGITSTSWPFLAGLAIGWLATLAWARDRSAPRTARSPAGARWRPAALAPAGLIAWLATVALGMTFRVISGQGTAAAFIGVALAFLGLFLLGWRILARYIQVIRS
jgi:hypothetical protein